MDTSTVLVQAASGLQKTMSGTNGTVLQDSTVAQISAAIYYQAMVASKITTNKQFQTKFQSILFNQIKKDFGNYVDAQARTNPKTLHHVYEWKKVGVPSGRLFDLKVGQKEGLSFKIVSEFKPSKSMVPTNFGKTRHVFTNKAAVMEAGMPITIRPKNAERLVFEMDGLVIRMPKGMPVVVKKPGGGKATSRYSIAHARFFTGNLVNLSIKNSKFQQIFSSSIAKSMKLPLNVKKVKYSFSPNTINMQAETALSAAFGGSNDNGL